MLESALRILVTPLCRHRHSHIPPQIEQLSVRKLIDSEDSRVAYNQGGRHFIMNFG